MLSYFLNPQMTQMDADDSSGLRTQESGVRSKGRDFFHHEGIEGHEGRRFAEVVPTSLRIGLADPARSELLPGLHSPLRAANAAAKLVYRKRS
jgi:hypothetical protein